jgi:hypothetical protein
MMQRSVTMGLLTMAVMSLSKISKIYDETVMEAEIRNSGHELT